MSGARFCWLASYPRSGNTWVRMLIGGLIGSVRVNDPGLPVLPAPVANRREFANLLGMEPSLLDDAALVDALPALHRAIADAGGAPVLFRKVHQMCGTSRAGEPLFPPERSLGAIHIVRDPRDVALSCAAYFGVELDAAIARMARGTTVLADNGSGSEQLPQPLGSWSAHAISWADDSAMPVLALRYEDLIDDPLSAVTQIAAFLGIDAARAPEAVRQADFARVRAAEAATGFREHVGGGDAFFRAGRAGQWRDAMTDDQAARVARDHGAAMTRFGYA